MADIPPELWALVAQHLPKNDLMSLRTVNRTFYAFSLDERYRIFAMDQINGVFLGKLEGLKVPGNATRVRELYLDPPILRELLSTEALYAHHPQAEEAQHRITHLAKRWFRKLLPASVSEESQDDVPSALNISEALTDIIPRLDNVSHFTLSWNESVLFDVPYLAWKSLARNLRHLDLEIHPHFATSRLPHDVHFPCLTTFKVMLCVTETDEAPSLLSQAAVELATFINSFCDTLQSLHVGSHHKRVLDQLYARLARFPHLRAFELCPQTFDNPNSFMPFLQSHADTLTSVTYVSDSNPQFRDGLSQLELQKLEKLTMRLAYVPYPVAWWTVSSPFSVSISSTLRVLSIEAAVTMKELEQLLDAFKPSVLEELSVSIHRFCVEALVSIAENLPTLTSLDLRIHDVVVKGGYPVTPGEFYPYISSTPHARQTTPEALIQYAKDILPSLKWMLQDITIKRRSCCGDLLLWGMMQLCAACMPTITSFAKRGTKQVPMPANVKPPGGNIHCSDLVCSFWGDGADMRA